MNDIIYQYGFLQKRIAGDIRLLTNSKSRGIEFDFFIMIRI